MSIDWSWLTNWFNAVLQFLANLGTWLLNGVVIVLKAIFWPIYDGLCTLIVTALNVLDLSGLVSTGFIASISGLPPALIYILNAISFMQGMTIIAGAITTRMIINLIPAEFTRV